MTWTKLSDDFADDCWTLSDAAFRTHVEGLTWSNRKLLDLRIPKADVRRFAKDPEAVTELIATRWWSDAGDAYLIRHHAQYQRSREDVIKQQAANAANGRRGGRPRKPPREQASELRTSSLETHSITDSHGESTTERDRTGQDGSGRHGPALRNGTKNENDWSEARRPGAQLRPVPAPLSDDSWQAMAAGYDH